MFLAVIVIHQYVLVINFCRPFKSCLDDLMKKHFEKQFAMILKK